MHPVDSTSLRLDGAVRILVLSDLHLEFAEFAPPNPETYDVLVLAGDVGVGNQAIHWARRVADIFDRPVIFVAGNHEFYRGERRQVIDRMRQEANESPNLHFLDRDEVVVEGIRFLGTTLWTDFTLNEALGTSISDAMTNAARGMNDFLLIKERLPHAADERRFQPTDAAREHQLSRDWLSERIADEGPMSMLPIVIVTHHAPSPRSVLPKYTGHRLSPCFANDLPPEFFAKPALWIHGHMHDSQDYVQGAVRVLCNPRGYRRKDSSFENADFNPGLVVNVQLSK